MLRITSTDHVDEVKGTFLLADMPQTVATQVAGQTLHYELNASRIWCTVPSEVAEIIEVNSTFRNGFCNVLGEKQVVRTVAQCNSAL